MLDCLEKLIGTNVEVGIVSGSDKVKLLEQFPLDMVNKLPWVFTENGLVAYKNGEHFASRSISDEIGEEKLQKFINFCLKYMSELTLPCKRGTFIEYRTGMLNVSPIGRNCNREERNAFEAYDKENKIRESFIAAIKENFPDLPLTYSIGGQISFDVFPTGWDKRYCL